MKERKTTVDFNGQEYEVTVDDQGIVWITDPPGSDSKSSYGQPSSKPVRTLEEAEEVALFMLEHSTP